MVASKKIIILSLFLLLLLNACVISKIGSIRLADLASYKSVQTIHFKYSFGLIVIPVTIKNRTYHFLFDSGFQTSAISKKMAAILNLKENGKINIYDSQGTKQKLPSGKLDSLHIANIKYENIGLFVNDFSQSPIFSCFHIDGVIGANIIRLNNWKIDYDKATIQIYQKDVAPYESKTIQTAFEIQKGMPFIDLYVNNRKVSFLIDIGYNSPTPSLSNKENRMQIDDKSIGYSSFGLFNQTKFDTTLFSYVNIKDSADFTLNKIVVNYANHQLPLIGNGFFKKYFNSIYLDFGHHLLLLNQRPDLDKNIYSYPFSPRLIENGIIIGAISPEFSKFNLGDTIIKINKLKLNEISPCEMMQEYWRTKQKRMPIVISIKNKNGQIHTFKIPIQSVGQEH